MSAARRRLRMSRAKELVAYCLLLGLSVPLLLLLPLL